MSFKSSNKFSKPLTSAKSVLRFIIATAVVSISFVAYASVSDRTSPIGQVCMSGDSCAAAPVAVAEGPRSGEDIYNSNCLACHNTGAAGAPKLGDVAAWTPRIAQGNDTLYKHAIEGFKGMPAKGLCMTCSDDDIKITVDYMVENSQ